ncbi:MULTISPECIES: VCBS repeat-containing protein [unclassified Streptomyces]|uniref:FG-GAP repeat domain-containing protein n=1 Tax=unclassified Streptomyces TaxID=2593676 RepID=UPI00165611BA|nr:VCBS repeat-containing protein [Streptomyces sp. CB02980]MCB8903933.1 VCBS repeat-containing protein [Streptomyces sp. CB02980]
MRHITASRRRIAAAVAVTLAATLGATALNAPAFATPATGTAAPAAARHDFNGNGTPDLVQIARDGKVFRWDTAYDAAAGKVTAKAPVAATAPGWSQSSRTEATGDLGGSAVGDAVGVGDDGHLRLYKGRGDGGFDAPVRVGAGWHTYNHLVGGADVTGDGKPDLLGVSHSGGDLFVHTGTGKDTAPFLPARKKVGPGWGVYRHLALGDFAGSKAGDIVAVDHNGILWLHQGKGDGTFANRTKVGAGWKVYDDIVGVGDANRDGRDDLIGVGPGGAAFYQGTGAWRAPFAPAQPFALNVIPNPFADLFI